MLAWVPFPADPPVNDTAHTVPPALFLPLALISGPAWIAAYVMMIRRGFIERWLAMPLIALFGNVAWEFMYSFVYVHPDVGIRVVGKLWIAFDLVILGQAVAFGRRDYDWLTPRSFKVTLMALAAMIFGFMALAPYEFGDEEGVYTGFGQNAVMSCAFVAMLLRRRSTDGQTMYIGLAKFVGTLAAVGMAITWYPNRVLPYLLYTIFVAADVTYLVLLYRRFQSEKVSPWRKI